MASKSITWHKEKILARLRGGMKIQKERAPHDELFRVAIFEVIRPTSTGVAKYYPGYWIVVEKKLIYKTHINWLPIKRYPLIKQPSQRRYLLPAQRRKTSIKITPRNRVVKALYALIDEGKCKVQCSNKEFSLQRVLGTATARRITLKESVL